MSQIEITQLFFEIRYQLEFLSLSIASTSTPGLLNGRHFVEDYWEYPHYKLRVNFLNFRELDPIAWWKIESIMLEYNGQLFEQRWNGEL